MAPPNHKGTWILNPTICLEGRKPNCVMNNDLQLVFKKKNMFILEKQTTYNEDLKSHQKSTLRDNDKQFFIPSSKNCSQLYHIPSCECALCYYVLVVGHKVRFQFFHTLKFYDEHKLLYILVYKFFFLQYWSYFQVIITMLIS